MSGLKRESSLRYGLLQLGLGFVLFASGQAFSMDERHSRGEEMLLASVAIDTAVLDTGLELALPEGSALAQSVGATKSQFQSPEGTGATAPKDSPGSLLWPIVAAVLGFSVVARRRSTDQSA